MRCVLPLGVLPAFADRRPRRLASAAPVLALVVGLLTPTAARAQNPCTDTSGTQLVLNPTRVIAQLPDHTATVLGSTTPLVATYELRTYIEGATAPVTTVDVPKASWTLAQGTTDCYGATLSSAAIAVNTKYVSRLVAKGSEGVGDSAESEPSNPFGRVNPGRVGVLRLRP